MPQLNQIRPPSSASRGRPGLLLPRFLILCLLAALPAACVTPSGALTAPIAQAQPAASPSPGVVLNAGILDGTVQPTSFEQVTQAIEGLYRDHPAVNSFIVQGVTYNPETRDKVLKICHEGGLAGSDVESDAQKALACAPLIFFFYRYGQESAVPESTTVARQLYWFASLNTPGEPAQVMTNLLRSWGVK